MPKIDNWGLWAWRGDGFSSHGTLWATLIFLVAQLPAGQTDEDLQQHFGLRVHDTPGSLVEAPAITRERFEDVFHDYDIIHGCTVTLVRIAGLTQTIRRLQEQCRQESQSFASVLVDAGEILESAPSAEVLRASHRHCNALG